ncbi:MAG: outer membrane beta-barrel protein [Lewinella sp.]
MHRFLLVTTFLLVFGISSHALSAQLRLTVDGGFAFATFNKKPVLPADTRVAFVLDADDNENIDPLEGGYVALGLAHQPSNKAWGWSTRLQYMKRGYRYQIERNSPNSFQAIDRAYSYTSFIDLFVLATTSINGKLRLNTGPFISLAISDNKVPFYNLNDPETSPDTRTDYGINAGLRYPFGRLSITANYQLSLRRYSFSSLNNAYSFAAGQPGLIALEKTPQISALRLGLEYAIWE